MKEEKKNKKQDEPAKKKPAAEAKEESDRRNFITGAAAVAVGGVVAMAPPAAGLVMFADPLRRKAQAGEFIHVANVDQIPTDGTPQSFRVIADRWDAWNFYPKEHIGAVYLRLSPQTQQIECVSAICPHLGCFVDFRTSQNNYKCPCHDSKFEANGERIDPEHCPSARDLDSLEVEIRNQNEVWVKFEKFKGGKKEKIAEA